MIGNVIEVNGNALGGYLAHGDSAVFELLVPGDYDILDSLGVKYTNANCFITLVEPPQ